MGFFLSFYLEKCFVALLLVILIALVARRISVIPRFTVVVIVATLLLTPSLGGVTIVVVPIPFGYWRYLSMVSGP